MLTAPRDELQSASILRRQAGSGEEPWVECQALGILVQFYCRPAE